jgi:hypothetical protein
LYGVRRLCFGTWREDSKRVGGAVGAHTTLPYREAPDLGLLKFTEGVEVEKERCPDWKRVKAVLTDWLPPLLLGAIGQFKAS